VSRFDDDTVTIVAAAALTPGFKHAPLVGIRRTFSEGDNIATRKFRTGQPATNWTPTVAGNARITNGLSVEADVVIAADGVYSTLQRYVVKPAGRCSPAWSPIAE
jgi:hypothetical protein